MDGATLSLVLEQDAEGIHEPEFVGYEPLVSFEAYLEGRRVFGWVRLGADRLTDLLNTHETVRLVNVLVEDLANGRTSASEESVVERSEIVAVVATGPRGDATRRLPTRPLPVEVEAGHYRIGGRIHAAPGDTVDERLHSGGPMVPLTSAWLEYRWGAERRRDRIETIIVNREQATRFALVADP